jgi:hypothetical protein
MVTGFIEGRNVAIDYRSTEGDVARLPLTARELVDRASDGNRRDQQYGGGACREGRDLNDSDRPGGRRPASP